MNVCPFCGAEVAAPTRSTTEPQLRVCKDCLNPFTVHWEGATPKCAVLPGSVDIRAVAPAGSIGGEILAQLRKAADNLPVLPEMAQRVMELVKRPDSSMRELAALIGEDAVMALKVLKVANSALYGGLSEIKDLNSACSRLGAKTVASVVQAVANGNLYITGHKKSREMMQTLWRHSVATACCADEIAKAIAEPRSDEYFFAGLIHDVGKVCLLDILSDAYSGVLGKLRDAPELLNEVLENYHTLAGLVVVSQWGLANEFAVTTYCHTDPSTAPFEDCSSMTHAIALASRIAHISGFGFGEDSGSSLVSHPSTAFLGLNDVRLATLRVDLMERLDNVLGVLESA
ncbi:MAG: HDOD domain-containing protein [Candidatus Hydrogenedentes bacterium]|nr:HDOD domain-containing protein [Candidatus Hydrogenedentota bacterium]